MARRSCASPHSRGSSSLPVAEAVADPDHAGRGQVAAVLRGEVGNVVQVELGTDEDVFGHKELNAHARMDLEVAGRPERLRLALADGGTHARTLGDVISGGGAANAAL